MELKEPVVASRNVYLVSDTHFGHAGVCKFTDAAGDPLRPWDDPDVMTEDMIQYWNDTVRPKDKVYHLGDVVINRRYLPVLDRLHGDKVLIKGNHDIFKLKDYSKYFRDIRGYHILGSFILSHIPVHPGQLRRWKGNIHGHLHSNELDDERYMNVCVEKTNFRPILFTDVLARFAERGIN